MTPISSIIEETIRLQHQTNVLQAICLAGIFIADIFILLCIVSVRKTIRINRAWTDANMRWSAALRSASGIETEGQDGETRLGAKHESPTPKGDAQEQPLEPKD